MRLNVEVPGLFLGSPGRLYGQSSDVLCCVIVIVWMVQGGPSDFLLEYVSRLCVMVYDE